LKILIEKGEDNYFVASVPSLKGCWSQGKTREEALENIREATELYLEPDEIQMAKRFKNQLNQSLFWKMIEEDKKTK